MRAQRVGQPAAFVADREGKRPSDVGVVKTAAFACDQCDDAATAGVATFTFTYPTYACTLSGTLAQHGRQYVISGASYTCTQSGATIFSGSANLSEITATAQGVEGRWTADTGSGCRESAQFSAVLL